ncbi:hypothetical protein ACIRNI_20550 [Streptomyces sp. NPDC093546]|uniref:hypothetical protein n=1 Tax=Streptomyces sp. NPDC093546 TaxID=3366040 RepID=UPI00382C8B86
MSDLQTSARGWHTVQLAVFGFIGICGVLKSGGGGATAAPRAIEEVAGVLVLVALAVACWATCLVARVAWPLPGPVPEPGATQGAAGADGPAAQAQERAARRLRAGLTLTFVAVVLVAAAAATSWWPAPAPAAPAGQLLRVTTPAGTFCGTLASGSGDGRVRVQAQGRSIDIPLDSVAELNPTPSCP